jgi:hypothetical protein
MLANSRTLPSRLCITSTLISATLRYKARLGREDYPRNLRGGIRRDGGDDFGGAPGLDIKKQKGLQRCAINNNAANTN